MITKEDAAEKLNNSEYGEEGSKELWAEMKVAGLVAVFGASDDLMEFRGAINDEVDAYDGTTVYLNGDGLFKSLCDNDDCPHERAQKKGATELEAFWDIDGFSWKYETDIPSIPFIVNEGGEPYCEGIVFALADVPA